MSITLAALRGCAVARTLYTPTTLDRAPARSQDLTQPPKKAMMKSNSIKFLLACGLLAVAAASAALPAVDVKQGAALQSSGALLIDVREADEYAQGHAPGSVLIPLGQLQQRLHEIVGYKNRPVALICRSGNRSAQALKLLESAGFSAAVNVEGGMIAWQKAGLPVISGAASR